MRSKPEKRISLFFFKCMFSECPKPFGLMQTIRVDAERGWIHHAHQFHEGKTSVAPFFIIKTKKFKEVG